MLIRPRLQETRGNLYVYSRIPPPPLELGGHNSVPLKDWGSGVEESEIFVTCHLEDFASTNFDNLFLRDSKNVPVPSATDLDVPAEPLPPLPMGTKRRRDQEEDYALERQNFNKRLRLDGHSLYHVMPQVR